MNNIKEINNEILLNEKDSLVSTTDLKGHIVYANDDFCRISKFSPMKT